MSQGVKAIVKSKMLVWTRETAGLNIEIAAKKLGTSTARISAWEDDKTEDRPTIKQLQKMAEIYKRPLGVFYLQQIPPTFKVLSDYRKPIGSQPRHYSPELMLEQRLINQRREQALELANYLEIKPTVFRLDADLDDDPEAIGARIRSYLQVSPEEQIGWSNNRIAFNAWREKVEEIGVLIFQISRVSSHELSGLAISYKVYPVIAINRKDTSFQRRSFTLFHEFAHLMLRKSGISELDIDTTHPAEEQRVEVWCNAVAAAVLIPRESFLSDEIVQRRLIDDWSDQQIELIARKFSVSREAVVRRLNGFHLASDTFYRTKQQQYANEWQKSQDRKKVGHKPQSFMKNPTQDVFSELGRPFVHLVLNTFYSHFITLSDVSSYLGVRVRHVPTIE